MTCSSGIHMYGLIKNGMQSRGTSDLTYHQKTAFRMILRLSMYKMRTAFVKLLSETRTFLRAASRNIIECFTPVLPWVPFSAFYRLSLQGWVNCSYRNWIFRWLDVDKHLQMHVRLRLVPVEDPEKKWQNYSILPENPMDRWASRLLFNRFAKGLEQ